MQPHMYIAAKSANKYRVREVIKMTTVLDFLNNYADVVFIPLLSISAFVFLAIVCWTAYKNKDFQISFVIKKAIDSFEGLTYLAQKSASIVSRKFLNHIVNNGQDPKCLTAEITIDEGYLSDSSNIYIKKR